MINLIQLIIEFILFFLLLGATYRIQRLENEITLLKRDKLNYLTKKGRFK